MVYVVDCYYGVQYCLYVFVVYDVGFGRVGLYYVDCDVMWFEIVCYVLGEVDDGSFGYVVDGCVGQVGLVGSYVVGNDDLVIVVYVGLCCLYGYECCLDVYCYYVIEVGQWIVVDGFVYEDVGVVDEDV